MGIDSIIAEIDAEIARLNEARTLLAGMGKLSITGKTAKSKPAAKKAKRSRVLSPEARKRIADAQRRRWAAQKKAKKEA